MTYWLHRGDLPADVGLGRRWRSIPRPWGCIRIATGSAWCRCRTATAAPMWCRSRRTIPSAEPEGAAGQSEDHQDLSLRPVRSRRALQRLRRDAAAGVLHQDRLAALPHLHRSPWPEGSGARGAQHRPVEAAAIARTGARRRLSEAQLAYAASDVLHLHALRERLDAMLAREGRERWRRPVSIFCRPGQLDLEGWDTEDIFAH